MGNYSFITKLFLKSIRDTVKNEFNPENIPESNSERCEITIERDSEGKVVKKLINIDGHRIYEELKSTPDYWFDQLRYLLPHLDPYRKYLFGKQNILADPSEMQCKDDKVGSSEDMLYVGYPISEFIKDLQCDLFAYISSELLFRRPQSYKKRYMGNYFSFESKKGKSKENTIGISDKVWDNFRKKKNLLNDTIKKYPMPPHFMDVYSDSKIKKMVYNGNINPLYSYLVTNDIYENMSLDNYLKFKDQVIFDKINWIRNGMLLEEGKPSTLIDFLTLFYIERVFQFSMVDFASVMISEFNYLFYKEQLYSDLFTTLKLSKSSNLFFSKFSLLYRLIGNGLQEVDIFRAVYRSFTRIAEKTLDRFVGNYKKVYKKDPWEALNKSENFTDLHNNLSTVYKDLFEEYVSKKQDDESDKPIDRLKAREKYLIMDNVVNPDAYLYENSFDLFFPFKSIRGKSIF